MKRLIKKSDTSYSVQVLLPNLDQKIDNNVGDGIQYTNTLNKEWLYNEDLNNAEWQLKESSKKWD